MSWVLAVTAFVALQRFVELLYANRNTRLLRARGAVEVAPEQHVFFILLHTAWLCAIVLTTPVHAAPNWPLMCVFAALQGLRIWVLATLGPLWTTRILVPPNTPPITGGPYRFMKHPNYVVVAGEIAVLPLIFGNVAVAVLFTILNAALLTWRLRAENASLAARCKPQASQDRATVR